MVMMILVMMRVIMMFKFETAETMNYEVQFEMFLKLCILSLHVA